MKYVLLTILLISNIVMAESFLSLDFNVTKIKCNMFGNLTLSISGLEEELGQTGIRNIRSYMKKKECKALLSNVKELVKSSRGTLVVDAESSQLITYTEYLRQGLTNPRPYPNPFPPTRYWYECEKRKNTDLTFPLEVSNQTLSFRASSSILISRTYGPCPRH